MSSAKGRQVYETEVIGENEKKSGMYMDFYRKLRMKIDAYIEEHPGLEFSKYLAAAADVFYLLIRLCLDSEVPASAKVRLGAAAAYFVAPIDIVPDFIPVAGWLDDLIVGVTLLNRAIDSVEPAIIDKYWLGEDKVYDFIKNVLDKGDKLVGTKIWNRIKKMFDEKSPGNNDEN